MKKENIYMILVLSVAFLVGCSEKPDGPQDLENAILFDASTGKHTSAPIVDNGTITTKPFGLFAYYTGQDTWATASAATVPAPNLMNNQEVIYANGSWGYAPLKYWPNTAAGKVSFFGYWPYDATVRAAAGESPTISFAQEVTDVKKMKDIAVSTLLDQTKRSDKVVLPFDHILTRLSFSAKVDDNISALNATKGVTGVFVTGLRILGTADTGTGVNASGTNSASKFYNNADYNLATNLTGGTWGYTKSTSVATALDIAPILDFVGSSFGGYSSNSIAVNRRGNSTSLLKGAESAFLIPPAGKTGITSPTDIRIQVDYEIVTVNASASSGFTKTATSATVSLPNGSLKERTAYNITLTIGLSQIGIDAHIIDWDSSTSQNSTSTTATSGSDIDIISAMGVLNGVKAANTNANHFVINVPKAATTSVDLSTAVALYNFEDGDQIALLYSTGVPTTITLPIGWSYKVVSGQAILVKESPKGWYLGDLTGAADATDIIILDASDAITDLGNLRALLLGSRARAVSTGSINLTMLNATGIQTDGFRNCTALKALSLPRIVTLGNTVFEGCTNLKGLALSTVYRLTTVGTELFGAGVTDCSAIDFITGSKTLGVNASAKTWTVNGSTYTFGSAVISQSPTIYIPTSGMFVGQQGWSNGETIPIP